jgi:hypothetical protein
MRPQLQEKFAFDAQSDLDANGFWTTKARFARPGIQVYTREEFADWPDSAKVEGYYARVLRPSEVVFDAEAMKTFENLPVSVEHSGDMLNPDNVSWQIVGAAGAPVTREGEMLTVPITLYERDAIDKAMSGERRELSAGYYLDVEYAPGTDSEYGEYDYVLKSWKGNHITLTRAGKAGPDFYVGDKMPEKKTDDGRAENLVVRALDGVSYTFGEQAAQVFDRVLGERDAARAELKKAKDAILGEDEIERRVNDRLTVLDSARSLSPETDFSGKATDAIVAEAVAVHYPEMDLKGKSADYIRALFDSAVAAAAKKPTEGKANDRALDGLNQNTETGGLAKARADFVNKNSGRR